MAKRKQTSTDTAQVNPETLTSPQPPEIVPAVPPEPPRLVSQQPKPEQAPRPLLADPFPFKTENLGGYKVHFQHSRQAGEFQIRFGDGSRNDMPPGEILDFIKSHKAQASDGSGEKSLFHWNENDRAWGMRINRDDPETSRQTAKNIFDDVVKLVAEERAPVPSR